jgi:hypothetical protein
MVVAKAVKVAHFVQGWDDARRMKSESGTSRHFAAARNLVATGAQRTLVKPLPFKPYL